MTLSLTGLFVLPDDVLLVPVAELSEEVRAQLGGDAGDVAITRPRSRRPSSIVDASSAQLLQLFRGSKRVVDAVVEFSRATDCDPRVVLERAFPLVERLVLGGVLLPDGDARADPIDAPYQTGNRIGEFTLLDLVQMLEDVELHRARHTDGGFAAIKIARSGYEKRLRASLEREAGVLRVMGGCGAPRLMALDLDATRPYLAMSWCPGVPPLRAADELRPGDTSALRERILDLSVRIATAYAELHERGVMHGDVHDRNVLVDATGAVTLIDFGLSVVAGHNADARKTRGGVAPYYDPQLAAALKDKVRAPRLDAGAEQYSVAALLYHVAAGASYLELSMRRTEALRQIVEDAPLSFTARGVAPWPELEHVLGRALSKNPAERYASLREFTAALREVPVRSHEAARPSARAAQRRAFVAAAFDRLDPGGDLFRDGLPNAPYATINNGAAGIAYAHYRSAAARDDATMLARADAWSWRARQWATNPQAYYTPDKAYSTKSVGTVAVYHTVTGIECVDALVALATGDTDRAARAGDAFVAAARTRTRLLDLTLGQAGVVLGGMLMLDASPERMPAVHAHCHKLAAALERKLCESGRLIDEGRVRFTGVAHGWAGILLTLIRWRSFVGETPSGAIKRRLDELAALATPRGRGRAWVWNLEARATGDEPHPAPSWCNGTAGHVHLWLAAYATYGDAGYAALAEAAAWNVWDDSRDRMADICCGMAGRAYSLLALHRHTGDDVWRRRAETLADRAMEASTPDGPTSHRLYKGALGVALLLDELEHAPEAARMPFFESEGWKWR